jgi:hypothetical protein
LLPIQLELNTRHSEVTQQHFQSRLRSDQHLLVATQFRESLPHVIRDAVSEQPGLGGIRIGQRQGEQTQWSALPRRRRRRLLGVRLKQLRTTHARNEVRWVACQCRKLHLQVRNDGSNICEGGRH